MPYYSLVEIYAKIKLWESVPDRTIKTVEDDE
jgi:hypothetical protein